MIHAIFKRGIIKVKGSVVLMILLFLLSFIGLVLGISGITYLFFFLSQKTKQNIITRKQWFTIIQFKDTVPLPNLLNNPEFLRMGQWQLSDDGLSYQGFATQSKETIRQWIMETYDLKPRQVLVILPEEMKIASSLPHV